MSASAVIDRLTFEGETEDGLQTFWQGPDAFVPPFMRRFQRSLKSGDGLAQDELVDVLEDEPDCHDLIQAAVEKALPLCESPIERIVLPWLLSRRYAPFPFSPLVLFPGEGAALRYGQIAVVPQLPIGRFRPDFALIGKGRETVRFILVECDGAEFHDADKDAARDAEIRLANPRVKDIVRLSGGLITNNPKSAAETVKARVTYEWSDQSYRQPIGMRSTGFWSFPK